MAFRTHRSRTGSGSKRLTQWVGPPEQGFLVVSAASSTIMGSIPFTEAATIVRIRGMFTVALSTYVADLEIVGAIGFGIISDEALAAGIASIPDPYDDANWGGWMLWQSFAHRFETLDATSSFLGSWSMELDSKAMRKVTPGESLIMMVESQAGAFRAAVAPRTLVKLS